MQSIYRPGVFADQVIVVSGGGTGIGAAIATSGCGATGAAIAISG